MTKAQETYCTTLNLLGSDLEVPPEIQSMVDREHAAADPEFKHVLDLRSAESLVA
jgi:hypothetical protein